VKKKPLEGRKNERVGGERKDPNVWKSRSPKVLELGGVLAKGAQKGCAGKEKESRVHEKKPFNQQRTARRKGNWGSVGIPEKVFEKPQLSSKWVLKKSPSKKRDIFRGRSTGGAGSSLGGHKRRSAAPGGPRKKKRPEWKERGGEE